MAMSATAVVTIDGVNMHAFDITATADGDTSLVINHGLSFQPDVFSLCGILQAPAALSAWAVTGASPATITVTKGTGAGSGNANAQVRLFCGRYWSAAS